jgi:hypothetical protein
MNKINIKCAAVNGFNTLQYSYSLTFYIDLFIPLLEPLLFMKNRNDCAIGTTALLYFWLIKTL